jgi:hypothetical protein
MSSKISELINAAALTGAEQLPGVQSGGNVKLTPLQLANFAASVPAGMNSFRELNFGLCSFDPNNNETINFKTASTDSAAVGLNVSDGAGGHTLIGYFGVRASSGLFFYATDNTQPVGFENVGGVSVNSTLVMDASGNLVDDLSNIVLNRSAGQQPAIANATGAGDVVARLNDVLAALRALGLIAT